MKQFCKYHPTATSHWYCEKCNTALCPQCVDTRAMGDTHHGEKLHMCPKCNLPATWVGVENIIDPFWKRLPQFFLYPFSLRPLMLMLVLSLVSTIFAGNGIIALLVAIAVWGVTLKYAYAILQATASGDLTSPELNRQTLSENFAPVIKQVGIYVVIFFAAGIIFTQVGFAVGVAYLIAATLFLPAMIILLVTTESLLHAINPMMFVTLAMRIGWGYLLMYFFYSILGGAPALLGQGVFQYLPPLLQLFLFTLVKLYYTFISYHLMGYVILQYHQDIGYQVDYGDFKDDRTEKGNAGAATDDATGMLLRRVDQLIKDGDHEGACGFIERETAGQDITDLLLSERYFTLLKLTGATDRLLIHGIGHINVLVRANLKSEAMDAYRDCLSNDTGFTPVATSLFKLGGWLNESGDSKAAISAFNKLTKAYPKDPLVPKSYFRSAQIFNDRLLNPQKAKKILNGLLARYPDHDIIPFVSRYLGQMG